MEPTIQCGRHLAENANLAGSQFHKVNLSEADFNDVNLSKARFHNINLSDVTITAAQIGGATFRHIGPPPCKEGGQARQRPVTIEEFYGKKHGFQKNGTHVEQETGQSKIKMRWKRLGA
jgi:hypothetical protein